MQKRKETTLHAGGKTALILKGFAQYIKLGEEEVYLFSDRSENLNQLPDPVRQRRTQPRCDASSFLPPSSIGLTTSVQGDRCVENQWRYLFDGARRCRSDAAVTRNIRPKAFWVDPKKAQDWVSRSPADLRSDILPCSGSFESHACGGGT